MMIPLRTPLCCLLVAGAAVAQVLPQYSRNWAPQSLDVARVLAADFDQDLRDDAILVLASGGMVRAAIPGIVSHFAPFSTYTDVVDAVACRQDDRPDVVVSVSPTHGLTVHQLGTDWTVTSTDSTTTSWTGVQRLRTATYRGIPVIAGIEADDRTVHVVALDIHLPDFNPIATVTFTGDLLDLEFAKGPTEPVPHLVGLQANGLRRRNLRDQQIDFSNFAADGGALVTLPDGLDVAWARLPAGGDEWQLTREVPDTPGNPGLVTVPVVLSGGAIPPALEITDIDAGDFDRDGHPDVLVGQNASGEAAVLRWDTGVSNWKNDFTHVDPVQFSAGAGGLPQHNAPAIVAHPDGSFDGVFFASDLAGELDVILTVEPPQQATGLPDYVPSLEDLLYQLPPSTPYTYDSIRCTFRLHPDYRAWAESMGAFELQITTMVMTNVVDHATGAPDLTNPNTLVAPIADDVWVLPEDPANGLLEERYQVDIPVERTFEQLVHDHDHLIFLVRAVITDLDANQQRVVIGATFTTPVCAALGWMVDDPNAPGFEMEVHSGFISTVTDPFFDPGELYDEVPGDHPGQIAYKHVVRIRRMFPILEPLTGTPGPIPLRGMGTARVPN